MAIFTLRRIRLNAGGYDRSGRYYGVGSPLYEYAADGINDDYAVDIRAADRADAKSIILAKYPNATFHN